MASTVENSVEIDRPTGDVFAFVDDYRNVTRYIVGMTEYKPTTSQTSGKGSKFRFVKKTTGLPDIKSEVEITEWVRDKRISFKSFSGFDNGGSYSFTARGDRTVVRLSNSYDLGSLLGGGRGGLFGGLAKAAGGVASKAAEGTVRKDLTTSLEKLRALVESEVKTRGTPAKQASATKAPAKKAPAKKAPAKKAPAKKVPSGR
jgi:uncharacterized membrane protein